MSDCIICFSDQAIKLNSKSKLRVHANVIHDAGINVKGKGLLNPNKMNQLALLKSKISSIGKIRDKNSQSHNLISLKSIDNFNIKSTIKFVSSAIRSRIGTYPKLNNKYVDKIGGNLDKINNIDNFVGLHKLYPIQDIQTSLNNSYFVDKYLNSGLLYQSIDEGIFIGNYQQPFKISQRLSDDNASFIQPSSIFTSGTFRYKCEVNRPVHHAKESFLFIRASAPLSNYGSNVPPEYRIHNIKLEDPSGNLIIKYKDIYLKGDADYRDLNIQNFSTYISEPEVNNLLLNTWDSKYPFMEEPSGYSLNMDFDVMCLDDPFSEGFDKGYEEQSCEIKSLNTPSKNEYLSLDGSPLSTQTQGYILNPTNSLRISAIEICNSGDLCNTCSITGIRRDSYFSFYTDVSLTGQRLTRSLLPVQLLTSDYNINLYPEVYSTWKSSVDGALNFAYNTTTSGAQTLVSRLQTSDLSDYIQLVNSTPLSDSGRLTLKFSHQPPGYVQTLSDGAFSFGDNSYDSAEWQSLEEVDNYFTVDSIELKVIAKKAVGSRDYVLDVVGYSDDKLLNVTPKIGAFLQNTNDGIGNVPQSSGFKNIDDLGISTESLSDKTQYYKSLLTNVDAGDHYKLSNLPLVNSTIFQEYTIPLTIYKDNYELGVPKDYSLSPYFESLYLDLYPIPSGATIASIQLVVNYKPSNGLMFFTLGTPTNRELSLKDIRLLPIGRNTQNDISINTDINNSPISIVSGIPQGYGEPLTLKTNYARRWRGVDGNIVNGPYDPNQFDFSFYNPQSNHPFLHSYFDFNNTSGNFVISSNYSNSGYYSGSLDIIKNIGLRFKNQSLFSHSTNYTTIDWTQPSDSLYGKISDSFDVALRTNSHSLDFNNSPYLASGFALYLRFTPDSQFNFNSDSLINIHESYYNNDLLSLKLVNNKLKLSARNSSSSYVELVDTKDFDSYQFPLSLLVTYDKNPNGKLNLYCRDELSNSQDLRLTTTISLDSRTTNRSLSFHKQLFLHEIGISSSGNIVSSNPNRLLKQTTAESFLSGHSHSFDDSCWSKYSLHSYIDDNSSSWKLGDFRVCSFSPDFDILTIRNGKDYLIHSLKHNGSGYSQITNLTLPSNINTSGLAYHTQIENDFLRFNLQDIPDVNPAFYAIQPRICKTIPRGYDFRKDAIVVDTILEHDTKNNLTWNNGNIGPKLIVSLYTKNQDPIDRPSKKNWGLINRSIHYLKPSGCYQKISSTLNYNDLIDTSEPWANFDLDTVYSEFDHKYYSTDINDMFLQYDLVYPSGSPFESTIKLHSANIRLDDALTYFTNSDQNINLYSSGEKISYSNIPLLTYGKGIIDFDFNLHTTGGSWPDTNSSMNLLVSGVGGIPANYFNLFVKNSGTVSSLGPDLYVSGGYPRDEKSMSLVMTDNSSANTSLNSLPLFVYSRGTLANNSNLLLFLAQYFTPREIYSTGKMSLYTQNEQIISNYSTNNFNLFINTDIDYGSSSGLFNLFTTNYLAYNQNANQQITITWNENNVGKSIESYDNSKAFLDANDEIRGVDLICYGDCDNNNSCKENPLVVHDNSWYDSSSCIEGGIFRVKSTYTNLEVSGFKTPVGYSGNFYGIRKYDGLIPNAPYDVTITSKTGSNIAIKLPRQFKEVNYGIDDSLGYSGIKFAADKYSLDSERQSGSRYGKSLAAKKDLLIVGAPKQTVPYSEYNSSGNIVITNLNNAGSVFVYRRNPRPSGYNWPVNDHRSDWSLETKLILPSGLLKDYPTEIKRNSINGITLPANITERYWNVGQEGRQFGYSLDLAINSGIKSFEEDKKEVIVVGAPFAQWSRQFDELKASGVTVGLLVFTDEFSPTVVNPNDPKDVWNHSKILETIQNKDLLFKYFSDPPVKFDVRVMICQPLASTSNRTLLDFPEPKPSYITKGVIPRNEGIVTEEDTLAVFSGIKSVFDTAFPYDNSKLNNNIPVMLGVYVDASRSLGRQAVTPGLDRFLDYYKNYSFASGLKDFYNVRSSGEVYEYFPSIGQSENWINISTITLNNLLDTGRIVSDNQIRFFSSAIGEDAFNVNLTEFNHSPPSGGRVYVFEKESGVWNLIQEISSPIVSYTTNDVFGHAVAVSEDTNVIAIGSPYINEACKIYQHRKEEKNRLFDSLPSWLYYKNGFYGGLVVRYSTLVENYLEWIQTYGTAYANKVLYSKLTSTEKFDARKYLNINEYENVFTYRYSDIPYVGTWDFIPKTFAPTSRLGYSVAVNDDGSTVAFGAPTDSFNAFDDFNVYYKNDGYNDPQNIGYLNGGIKPSWKSNTNAGAVRLFEARDYFPHNKAIEFRKFGNLQENNPLDSGHFNYLSTIFQDKQFTKTPFEKVDIPQDAGLAFIITPEVDALSDEVMENIVSWLSLGDRNLVLVGNDPVWEENGKYKISNDIINKILTKLKSKVRLHPAKNLYESLPSGGSLALPSFRPQNGTQSYVKPYEIQTLYGVADIRMHFPGYSKHMTCVSGTVNDKCEMPLIHNGDLRAQWFESCPNYKCGIDKINYPINWAYVFKTYSPECCQLVSEFLDNDRFDLPNQDPIPLLAAGEVTIAKRIIPAVPEQYDFIPNFEEEVVYTTTTTYQFDENNVGLVPAFVWNSGTNNSTIYETNINNINGELFYTPEEFNGRQSLLQARGSAITDILYGSELITTRATYCIQQDFGTSKLFAIAGTATETQNALMSGAGDNNINFYTNLVSKNVNGGSKIAQLGGWTGRSSFVSANPNSILYEIFRNSGNDVDQNVINISILYDVCWIANPVSLPSTQELNNIKTWLNTGNKKLIITHDSSLPQMLLVTEL